MDQSWAWIWRMDCNTGHLFILHWGLHSHFRQYYCYGCFVFGLLRCIDGAFTGSFYRKFKVTQNVASVNLWSMNESSFSTTYVYVVKNFNKFFYFWFVVHRHPSTCLYCKCSRSSYFVRPQYDQFKHSTNDSSYPPTTNYDFGVAIICIYTQNDSRKRKFNIFLSVNLFDLSISFRLDVVELMDLMTIWFWDNRSHQLAEIQSLVMHFSTDVLMNWLGSWKTSLDGLQG